MRDVDHRNSRVQVMQALNVVEFKLGFSEPKTNKARRSVALDLVTAGALRTHRAQQAAGVGRELVEVRTRSATSAGSILEARTIVGSRPYR